MAPAIPLNATGEEQEESAQTGRRAVPLLFQGSVRYGLVPGGRDAEVDPLHAQAVVLADALEADLVATVGRWYSWKRAA